MRTENVILTGFMGSGKSSVGQVLANRLGYRFVDTDLLIEQRAGKSIADIFTLEGETEFRNREKTIARELSTVRQHVIATGGRLMLDGENAAVLGATGPVFCLAAKAEEIANRLKQDDGIRPLLAGPDPVGRIKELLAARAEAYARFPQIITDGRTVQAVAEEIHTLLGKKVIPVTHPHGSYNVVVGPDLLASVRLLGHIQGPMVMITDSNVGPLFADACAADFVVTLPAGEENKTLATTNEIYARLLGAGIDRGGTVVALGGGVVGDVAGFVAATYMRGVDFVQCPTSLLAMVDASVGGKTGVDLPEGKNLVGAFKQPTAVLADLLTLSTLPDAEFTAGMAEVIKSGVIADPGLFLLVEQRAGELMAREDGAFDLLANIVSRSIEVKRQIVQEDPYERGRRALLNLGHTFGHAIEQVSGYSIRHGEAVAMGLVAAANLSARTGLCAANLELRLAAVLDSIGLPTRIPGHLESEAIMAAMKSDKKKLSGRLRFVLPRDVGDVIITDAVSRDQVQAALTFCGAR